MKNLFLTLALMCCVSFAFANEGDDLKKDAENPKIESKKILKGTDSKPFVIMNNYLDETHCSGNSCTTHCTTIAGTASNNQVIEAWYYYENFWCGG